MPKTYAQLWDKGRVEAENSSFRKMLSHSGFVRKNKKPGAIINHSTTVLTSFIPVPVVGTLVGIAVDKAVTTSKKASHSFKDDGDLNLKREVKHGIKNLDLDKLDRSRAKVTSAFKDLDKLVELRGDFISPCQHIIKTSTAFHYLHRRIRKLRLQADTMIKMGEATVQWGNQVENSLTNNQGDLDRHLQVSANHGAHVDCDRAYCTRR